MNTNPSFTEYDSKRLENHYLQITTPLSSTSTTSPPYSERVSLLINAIALIVSGICQVHFKITKLNYPSSYDEYSYCFWRYLFSAIVNYPIMLYTHSSLKPFNVLKSNIWFWIRTIDQFVVFETYLFILSFFRASTATCFVSMAPAVILILGVFILNENFYMRYIYGIAICFIGVLLIVSNETSAATEKGHNTVWVVFMGSFWGIVQLISVALHRVSSKMLLKDVIDEDTQVMYTSAVNCVLPLCCMVFVGKGFVMDIGYIWNCAVNGAMWVLFTRLLILSLKGVDLNKTTAIGYITVVTVFILGAIFLGEKIHVTDVIGSLLILGFNVYNSMYPVNK